MTDIWRARGDARTRRNLRLRLWRRTACVVLACVGVVGAGVATAAGGRPPTPSVTISGAARTSPLPPDFLGLALEYSSVPGLVSPQPNNVFVQLLRNLVPSVRPIIRIGGQSTDRTWWPVPHLTRPRGVTYNLGPRWLLDARRLGGLTGAKYILGINVESARSRIAAEEATVFNAALGPIFIDALELGNEPELYTRLPWYRVLRGADVAWYRRDGSPVYARRPTYGPVDFDQEFARTLKVMPKVAIAGPGTGVLRWLQGFRPFIRRDSGVRFLSWHRYGLNQCITDPNSPHYPTVPNLLSTWASRDLNGGRPYIALAHAAGEKFLIDEFGSVTCNGRTGVSDTFASALWALDALFWIDSAGVDGVNLHTYPRLANGLFDFTYSHGRWTGDVHPLYYGALMFSQAAPAGSQILRITTPPQPDVRVWATKAPDHRVRVLLVNDSMTAGAQIPVTVPLHSATATVERLEAPSAYARSGVTLGGVSYGSSTVSGVLPPARLPTVAFRAGRFSLTLPKASAALVTLSPPGYRIPSP